MGNFLSEWLAQEFCEVEPRDFYRGIFPSGELDEENAFTPGKYVGIIVAVTSERKSDGTRKVKRYSITDELNAVDIAVASNDFCLCAPLSYAGKQRTAEHARMLYAIAIDVDQIKMLSDERSGCPVGLRDLLHQMKNRVFPQPTYIVSSGNGLHLYFVLESPVPLYKEIAKELQTLKWDLTRKIWNEYVVDIKDDREIQQEGIYQGFRMPGTVTKNGGRAVAFQTGGKVTIEYLNSFVDYMTKAQKAAKLKAMEKKKISLAEAEKKWPEWYERRIANQQPRGVWCVNRALYDWWKKQIEKGAKVGHRYYCVMTLAVYAQKCSHYDPRHNPNPVTREELENDCFSLIEPFDGMTDNENNHFGADDVLDALEAFDAKWITYPRASIEYKSGIMIPANRRNGQPQADHLEEARAIRDIRSRRRGEKWDDNNGRKSKESIVVEWRQEHPNGTIKECIAETGVSRATVYRHWECNSRG